MKIWMEYGSEHSANLVIIGEFETLADADDAERLLVMMTQYAEKDADQGQLVAGRIVENFSDRVAQVCDMNDFHSFGYEDPEQLLYEYNVIREEKRLVITTEEEKIQAFIKILLHKGAVVQVYSAHDHPGKYGR